MPIAFKINIILPHHVTLLRVTENCFCNHTFMFRQIFFLKLTILAYVWQTIEICWNYSSYFFPND